MRKNRFTPYLLDFKFDLESASRISSCTVIPPYGTLVSPVKENSKRVKFSLTIVLYRNTLIQSDSSYFCQKAKKMLQ